MKDKDTTEFLDQNGNGNCIEPTKSKKGKEMVKETQKDLTQEKVEKLIWGAADLVRDSFGIENGNLHSVVLPITILKRIMDQREDYIKKNFMSMEEYKSDNLDLLTIYEMEETNISSIFKTKTSELFFITYDDLVNFTNGDGSEREIELSIDKNIKIKTTAKNVIEFLKEVSLDFNHNVLHKVLIDSDFFRGYLEDSKKVTSNNIVELLNHLNEIHFGSNISEDMFSKIYMYIIERFAGDAGKKGGEFFTPDKICDLSVRCMNFQVPEKGTIKIADLTAGSATFIITAGRIFQEQNAKILERFEVYAQELVGSSLLMGEVGLLLAGYENLNVFHANTITEYNQNIGKYRNTMDIVVGNPPYGLKDYGIKYAEANKSEQRWSYGIPKKGEGEYAFIQTALDMVHNKGAVSLVLPLGTLFKDSTKAAREMMLKEDIVEGIVVLPGNMFQTTGIPTCIWILNKDKRTEDKGKVFMLDTTNSAWKDGKYNTIDYVKTIDMFVNRKEEEGFSGYVDLQDIEDKDFNLSVQRYIFKDEPEEEIDIVSLISEIKDLKVEISKKETEMDSIFNQIIDLQGTK